MAFTPHPVDDAELNRILDEELATGITFDNDDDKDRREHALDYYDGRMRDLKAPKGRSSVVARVLAEQVDRILPGLLRVFDGSEKVVSYSPTRPGDEPAAKQATDYVNYIWESECDGYAVLQAAIQDALVVRNGIIKVYWDPEREFHTERLTGVSAEQMVMLFGDEAAGIPPQEPGIELAGSRAYQEMVGGQPGMPAQEVTLYEIEIRRVTQNGRLKVETVAPEDFGISMRGKTIDTAPWVWQRSRLTRSDLIKQGYDRMTVEELPAYSGRPYERYERGYGDREDVDRSQGLGAMEEVEVTEAYGFCDLDGDGIAESVRVVRAGGPGGREILAKEPWTDERPFVDLKPYMVPHRWMGASVSDKVMDLQRVSTALWRGGLDSLYASIMPEWEVVESQVKNPDEVRERRFGGIIRVTQAGAITPIVAPNVSDIAFNGIAAIDKVIERRTGVSQATASLDETALNPQTATASQLEHDAGYARVEMIARNMARMGLRPLFRKMLKLVVANQDRARTIRLRDQWVEFDPRSWDAGMDVDINLGLGTGSRERDLGMLAQVLNQQELIIKQFGLNNPVAGIEQIVGTLQKMVEASGMRNPEQFFKMPTPEQIQAYMASKPPPMDAKIAAIQARTQAQMQALQQRGQLEQQKMQLDVQGRQQKAQIDAQTGVATAQAKIEQDAQRLQAEMQMKREELQQEFDLRRQELELEAHLKLQEMQHGLHLSGMAELARPQ
jgi:hypothetical protein